MARARATRTRKQSTYTDPALRDRLKGRILAGDRGVRAGQWSARKAQLLAAQYERMGGGYVGTRSGAQKHLVQWTQERWRSADGGKARRGKTTARYLPDEAWKRLMPAQRRSTEKRKRAASRKGRQLVANTAPAKQARRAATASAGGSGGRGKRSAAGSAGQRPDPRREPTRKAARRTGTSRRGGATHRTRGTKGAASRR